MAINASRSQLIWTPILGWALLACAASVVQAQEETAAPAEQTLEQQTPVVDLPVHDLFSPGGTGRPDNELGIALGAYQLYPSIEILGGYDNNVFATSAPTTGSLFTVIKPQLELKSEWLNHSISVLASGGFGFYASAPTQNYQNYALLASGKLEIREDLYVTGKIGAQRATEALGTPNTSFATAPTVVDTIPIEFSLYQRFNRFFYQLTVAATRYWYYDNSVISGDALPGTSRDYTGAEERLRFGYEISDDASIFIEPGLNQRIYTQFINVAGQQRDSRGWFINFGGSKAFSAKSKLEGFIGYQSLSYLADGTTTGATTFGLTGSWNGYGPLTLRPMILRTINESALSTYQNYVSTTVGVDFTYDIHGPWQAVGGASINTADWTPAAGVPNVNPRTDYFTKVSLGVMYSLRPQVQIGPLYEHTQGWSTDVPAGGPEYTRDQISIRLVARR